MCQRLGLSWHNARRLNKKIDKLPKTRPRFVRDKVTIKGRSFTFYYRDIIACIKALFGDPDFAPYLAFVPERHYLDEDRTVRLYHDMHTGKWWWSTQVRSILMFFCISF